MKVKEALDYVKRYRSGEDFLKTAATAPEEIELHKIDSFERRSEREKIENWNSSEMH